MSSIHNDLATWAGRARVLGFNTINIDLKTAEAASAKIVEQANEIADLERRVKQLEEAQTNAREAFLSMIADADVWDEDVDGDIDSNGRTTMSVTYRLTTDHFSFEQLTDALGIEPRYMESLKDCIDRLAFEPDPRFNGGSNERA